MLGLVTRPKTGDMTTSSINTFINAVMIVFLYLSEILPKIRRSHDPGDRPGAAPGPSGTDRRPPASNDRRRGRPNSVEVRRLLRRLHVAVAAESCPGCGGILEHEGESLAYVTDIPAMPRPQVTEYRVQIPYRGTGQACRCRSCGRRVRGRHPDVGPDQYGASAHRVGRRVMAAAHMLHYGVGIPVRRVPVVLRALTGVKLSQSAITQDALRRARGAVGDAYHRLRESVRERAVVHTDDTGWRVGGESAFLMAFETDDATVYQVRSRHRNEEVREVVPGDYAGVMVTDRARSYDARALSGVRQLAAARLTCCARSVRWSRPR